MKLDPTWEELEHLHRRRLTQQLWKDFRPTKQSMEWYKHNTPTTSPFVTDYKEAMRPQVVDLPQANSDVCGEEGIERARQQTFEENDDLMRKLADS